MTEKRKMNDFRMNNLAYIQAGDYYIPDIRLQPIEEKELGKYGRMRRVFLQEYKPMLFDDLVLTEQLFPHLYESTGNGKKQEWNGLWKDYWKRIRHWRKRRMPWLG